MTAPVSLDDSQRSLRMAARALGRHGLAHAYGHISLRLDEARLLVCAPRPMGLIAAGEAGIEVPIDGPLPAGVLGEVRIHQQIYQRRPDVRAIARSMPPQLMALGAARLTPRALHGMGSYFGAGAALWDDPQLIRDDARAAALASTLGAGNAIVMRGNGLVVAASSLEQVLVLTWYLEDAARIDLSLRQAGLSAAAIELDEASRAARMTWAGGIAERMWEYLTAGDPEA